MKTGSPPRYAGKESLSEEEIKGLAWVEWATPKDGLKAYAVHPKDPTRTLHGQVIPDNVAPAQWDTIRCAHSLRKVGEMHFRWKLAQCKDEPEGPWPAKQLPLMGCLVVKAKGVFEVWYRGELIITADTKVFHPDRGWWVKETESEFLLWSQEKVCARARNKRRKS